MERDRHSRRRSYQAQHRPALGGNLQYRSSTSLGVEDTRGRRTSSSAYPIRQSQLLPPQDPSTTTAISDTINGQSIGDYGWSQTSPYSSQLTHELSADYTTNDLQLSHRDVPDPIYARQVAYGSDQLSRGNVGSRQTLRTASTYQTLPPTSSGYLSTQLENQSYHGLGHDPISDTFGTHTTTSYNQSLPYAYSEQHEPQTLTPIYTEPTYLQNSGYTNEHQLQQTDYGRLESQQKTTQDDFAPYDRLLRKTNSHTLEGRLVDARSSLLRLSRGLLENSERLGKITLLKIGANALLTITEVLPRTSLVRPAHGVSLTTRG